MGFTTTITFHGVEGSRKVKRGTFASTDSDTGGDVDTGLKMCEAFTMTVEVAVVGNNPVVNGTLPLAGDAVPIVTDANAVGTWEAKGY